MMCSAAEVQALSVLFFLVPCLWVMFKPTGTIAGCSVIWGKCPESKLQPSRSPHSKMFLNYHNFKHLVHHTVLIDEYVSHIISALADMV